MKARQQPGLLFHPKELKIDFLQAHQIMMEA